MYIHIEKKLNLGYYFNYPIKTKPPKRYVNIYTKDLGTKLLN